MGGGLASHELAAAVSDAGALGTIGIVDPEALRGEIAAARRLTGRPLAVNLIVPLARRRALGGGRGRRPRRHPLGGATAAANGEAVDPHRRHRERGARGRRGGRRRGDRPGRRVGRPRPRHDPGARAARAGALRPAGRLSRSSSPAGSPTAPTSAPRSRPARRAAVAGTRFLASDESGAHADYKRRLVDGRETVLTELFGMAWPRAPHRVLENDATRRWLKGDPRGPAADPRAPPRALPRRPADSGLDSAQARQAGELGGTRPGAPGANRRRCRPPPSRRTRSTPARRWRGSTRYGRQREDRPRPGPVGDQRIG